MPRLKKEEIKVAAKVLKPAEISSEAKPTEREPRNMEQYLGLAAQVAESTIYCGNWKFKNAEKHFPHDPLLRTVDKFFPYAKGGALFVDEPRSKRDEEHCQRKAKAIHEEGQRYVYLLSEMNLDEAMQQLEGTKA